MISIIKLGNAIYENIEPYYIDPETNQQVWNIPQDFTALQLAVIDTLGWIVGQRIFRAAQNDITKRHAAITKTHVLLAKVIDTLITTNNLSFDPVTQLTTNEQTIWNNLLLLAADGYCDSQLTSNLSQVIKDQLSWYATEVTNVQNMTTVDELVSYLETLTI